MAPKSLLRILFQNIMSNNKNLKILAIIPAKGNSKRFYKKNMHRVWGKPMIYWSIDACKNSIYDIDIWVNTDSNEISEYAEELEVKVHCRSEHLKDPEIYKMRIIRDTVRHIISNYYQPDIVISLQANSPEIESIHIDSAIKKIIDENLFEIISVDEKLVQNGAFRVLRGPNILQKDLSTYCAAFICDIKDIHYESDLNLIGEKNGNNR